MDRVVAVVQARMGSTRFPGKIFTLLVGRPLLWHVAHRLRACRLVDEIVVATSTSPADDEVVRFGERIGFAVVRGPEENVLERFLLAARATRADVVVRVTGDAPLIDADVVDRTIAALLATGAEFATGMPGVPCIHEGAAPVRTATLERLAREVGDDPIAREHVTGYLVAHPRFARTAYVPIPEDLRFSGARVSVDVPADLQFLEAVYARLGAPPGEAHLADVVRLLRSDPRLLDINGHVVQKRSGAIARLFLVRCDGDATLGLGHVARGLAVAECLRDEMGAGVRFAVSRGELAHQRIAAAGFPIDEPPPGVNEGSWVADLARRHNAAAVLLDVRTALGADDVRRIRETGARVAVLDDKSDRRLAADWAIYPPVPQLSSLPWDGASTDVRSGWEWIVLRRQFAVPPVRERHDPPVVLVAMGGADPLHLTLKAVAALDEVASPLRLRVAIGPGFGARSELAARLAKSRHPHEVLAGAFDLRDAMVGADFAVAAFGVTAYELAASGTPAILLAIDDDAARSASALHAVGAARLLGVHERVTVRELARDAARLAADPGERESMGATARALVDGEGARRVAALLVSGEVR